MTIAASKRKTALQACIYVKLMLKSGFYMAKVKIKQDGEGGGVCNAR